MSAPTSAEKRARATTLTAPHAADPISGNLEVQWASAFDRLCYDVSAPAMPRKHPERYDTLLAALTAGTGCTEDEVLSHGQKVRSMLFFAEDKLARQGVMARLAANQRHPYRLAPVPQSF